MKQHKKKKYFNAKYIYIYTIIFKYNININTYVEISDKIINERQTEKIAHIYKTRSQINFGLSHNINAAVFKL